MNIKKKVKTNLVLVVDNTFTSTLKLLREKQKTYINARLKLQKEKKFIDELIKKYGDAIIKTENKITKIEGDINVKKRTKEPRDIRPSRSKTKNTTKWTVR